MSRRPGFTLLEVMVTVLLGSVIALLVHGTARVGLDASARQQEQRDGTEAQLFVRSFLTDALRFPAQGGGAAMNDTLFTLESGTVEGGPGGDRLRFRSRAGFTDGNGTGNWQVTLSSSRLGVVFQAVSLSDGMAPVEVVLGDLSGVEVRVLDRTDDRTWLDRWDLIGRVPAAVSIDFIPRAGRPAPAPMLVHTALDLVR